MESVYIAVGSNKGDRNANVLKALRHMADYISITKISSFIRTKPQEGVDGRFFINGVIEGKTHLSPAEVFKFLQNTEELSGRKHPHKKLDEREIDLDIIFYGTRIIRTKQITVPHPRYRKRGFVLAPLFEIAPDFTDPQTGQTVEDIYKRQKNESLHKDF